MFRQYVLDRALRPAVAPPLASASLAGELRSLIGRAERQHRVLIGWSGHELEVIETHCPELGPAFAAVYRDAKVPAKAWGRLTGLKLTKDERGRRHRLASYEVAAGVVRSDAPGPKQMSRAIRGLREAIERDGTGTIGEEVRARWQRMLAHNELDCRGTRTVAMRALEDLEHAGAVTRADDARTRKGKGKGKKAKRKARRKAA
jgi:hypothetical protein